jgi:hypothetical protein
MRSFPRSDRQISKAKIAQAERLGQSGAFGKRKRCKKGKSCGASCIANYKVCMVDLPWVGQDSMNNIRKTLMERTTKPAQTLKPGPKYFPVAPLFEVDKNRPQVEAEGRPFRFNEK